MDGEMRRSSLKIRLNLKIVRLIWKPSIIFDSRNKFRPSFFIFFLFVFAKKPGSVLFACTEPIKNKHSNGNSWRQQNK